MQTKTFFSEYCQDHLRAEQVDDFIDEWHLGDGEGLELYEYLGMTWLEYGAFVMDASILPTLREARL